jgi:hypothetical protein
MVIRHPGSPITRFVGFVGVNGWLVGWLGGWLFGWSGLTIRHLPSFITHRAVSTIARDRSTIRVHP